jgi:hypothetical protein
MKSGPHALGGAEQSCRKVSLAPAKGHGGQLQQAGGDLAAVTDLLENVKRLAE